MALMKCAECEKEISDKASSCPGCGHPVSEIERIRGSQIEKTLEYPELPENLDIGELMVDLEGDGTLDGHFDYQENVMRKLPEGTVRLHLHTHGLKIFRGLSGMYDIHNSQIINLQQTSGEALSKTEKKSVVGRAVVGGLLLGPVGAVVGGMSGLGGTKEKIINKDYLVINYWDVETKTPQTLLISGKKEKISAFINRLEKEKELDKNGRVYKRPSLLKGKIFIIGVLLVFILLIWAAVS